MWRELRHRTKEWLSYQKEAKTKYYLHSPFVYNFYLNVLEAPFSEMQKQIDRYHEGFKQDKTLLTINDFGAVSGTYKKRVCDIAKSAATDAKYGKILGQWIAQSDSYFVVELGTSLGISSAYMAIAKPDLDITTFEGSDELIIRAKTLHQELQLKNISYINGNIDKTLSDFIKQTPRVDFAFIDANHTEEATLRYFNTIKQKVNENSVIVLDDIYWSEGMTRAWDTIKKDSDVTLTIDLYRQGWVFFHKQKLSKENFKLRF